MEERSSETTEKFGDEDPPAGVSNQNAEQGPGPQGGGAVADRSGAKPHEDDDAARDGASGEGSQSTGHPGNAG